MSKHSKKSKKNYQLVPTKPKKEKSKLKFAVLDIETANWTRFLVAGVYDGISFHTYRSMSECVEDLLSHYDGYSIFAHFGGRFDFLFVLKAVLQSWNKGIAWDLGEMVPRGSGILCFDLTYEGKKILFRDSSAFLPFSLRKITENFGVEHVKQQIDYDKITKVTPKLIEYLEYDCKGLYESIEKYFSWDLIEKAGPAFTIAGQSLRVLQLFLQKPVAALSEKLDRAIRPAYQGGRTEIFKQVYQGNGKPLYCYDVNSLYPYVMRENEYPNAFEYETDTFEEESLGFWKGVACVSDKEYLPCLGTVYEGRFVFPTGKISGIWTTSEINYARRMGYSFQCDRGWVFSSSGFLFREYIDALYERRLRAEKNSVDNVITKLLMNSCYGRFGLRSEREVLSFFDDFSEGLDIVAEFEVDSQTYLLCKEPKDIRSFKNVAIAAYVTSYARIHMHQLMYPLRDTLFYTDTDSIFTTKCLPTSENIGGLKFEYSVDRACFLLPKTYIAGDKIVMKGFDKKKIQNFTFEDFEASLEGELRLKVVEEPKFATFKTALRYGDLTSLTKGGTRQLRSQYTKRMRIPKTDYLDTKPIHIGS